jgi:hypothetical protein
MLNPDGKVQGVFVATGVKTLTTEVPVGSDIEFGRNVAACGSVALGTTTVVVLVETGIAGPQAATRIEQARNRIRFISRSFLRSYHP